MRFFVLDVGMPYILVGPPLCLAGFGETIARAADAAQGAAFIPAEAAASGIL